MKKISRKVPQSVKTQRKIDTAVDAALKRQSQTYINVKQRNDAEIEQLRDDIAQSFKHHKQIVPDYSHGLFEETPQAKKSLLPVRDPVHGLLTPDAKQSWKRYSNITLAIIIATQAFFASLDPEVIAALPDNIQYYIAIAQALLGIGASVINQTKRKGAADV